MHVRRLAFACLLVLSNCSHPVPRSGDARVFVIERGWHTDIGLPVAQMKQPLASLAPAGAQYLTFGFGERQFLTQRNPGFGLMLSALLPSQSALLITALRKPPEDAFGAANVAVLHVPQEEADRVADYVWASIVQNGSGPPAPLAEGPYPGGTFYPGRPIYSALFTCNTWTAGSLEAAGVITRAFGILFSGQVMGLARAAGGR